MNGSRLLSLLAILAASLLLGGCASITGGTQQSVSVETRQETAQVSGAACELVNAKGKWFLTSPGSVQIQRSNDDLLVTCNKPGLEPGRASVTSIVKPGMVGNFFFGGIIGVAIDHASGAAYDYPNMIQVMMGQMTKVGYTEGHATTHTTATPAGAPPGVTQTSVTPAGVTTTETLTLTSAGTVATNTAISPSSSPQATAPPAATAATANTPVAPVSLDAAKNQCVELGIKPQTEAFGQCVMRIAK
ncbi:hypothetical protein [Zwartia vadi]|uniref:hypothetical protein n=1 Tax=Zwartia vadi TaxID=3058168 RepID=UPI0025B60BA2|nr:hypothetical protein [Zwartia vadi]MDN3987959.1 hypothetical protein [Zwartia vadi]